MNVKSILSVMALSFLALSSFLTMFPAVFAVTGWHATSCSSLAACNYTDTNSSGVVIGTASASGGISGYVGQNFTFYGGAVSFKLPGETLTSNDAGVYNGQAINTKVFTSAAGLIYKVTGSFAAADYNTGKIVKGLTHGFVGIKGHSGRGGGIYFILLNGTISFTVTSQYATLLTVGCNPTSFQATTPTTCSATVADLKGGSVPTGKVTFSSSLGFSPTSCTLVSGTCSVQLYPAPGTWPVYVNYAGDSSHYASSARGPELYVGCPPDGC